MIPTFRLTISVAFAALLVSPAQAETPDSEVFCRAPSAKSASSSG